jgi:hypothetical protein
VFATVIIVLVFLPIWVAGIEGGADAVGFAYIFPCGVVVVAIVTPHSALRSCQRPIDSARARGIAHCI